MFNHPTLSAQLVHDRQSDLAEEVARSRVWRRPSRLTGVRSGMAAGLRTVADRLDSCEG